MLTHETLLDITVNVIPMVIIVFFAAVLLLASQWETTPFLTAVSLGLLVVPFVVLSLVTWVSARAIQQAEFGEERTEPRD